MKTPRTSRRAPRAFSLVEVLMAVLILGLGLLGLGAIMPAVVKQQRIGSDQTFGTLATRTVAATVKGNRLLSTRNATGNTSNNNMQAYTRWEAWARCISSAGYTYDIPEDGTWRVLEVEADTSGVGTARAIIGPFGTGITNNDDAFINLADRLYPSVGAVTAGTGVAIEPQFVVDLAVRRVTPLEPAQIGAGGAIVYETPGNFTVQMALIARRIDQRIRADAGLSVMQSLLDPSLTQSQRRWPVSEDNQGNALGGGEVIGPGSPRYSLPYLVNVDYDPQFPDRLTVVSAVDSALIGGGTQRSNQTAFAQASAPGQTVIDNLGNIYTVQGADERVPNGVAFRITPSVPSGTPGSGSGERRRLHQVLVSPQPPAAVSIITVNP